VGGWMLAIGEMRGNLAELTRRLLCVAGAVGAPAVVFPVAAPHRRRTLRPGSGTAEGRGPGPRLVRVS
jgi:hypothetical protein